MRRTVTGLIVLGMVLAGCSTDPTSTEEYQEVEDLLAAVQQQVVDLQQELADVSARRDAF
jgi:outer membrane murein-binding lipoprotein Lpp